MRMEVRFIRGESHARLPSIFVPEGVESHRPRIRYPLHLNSLPDVEKARAANIPVFLLDSTLVTALGHPMHFPPFLLLPRSLLPAVRSRLRILELASEETLKDPRVEEVIAILLRFDIMAARAIAIRNSRYLDAMRLYQAICREGLEAEATRVRLNELAPIPIVGKGFPKERLDRIALRNVRPVGAL